MVVYTVAAALRTMCEAVTTSSVLPSARVQAANGQWLNVHASRLHGEAGTERIAVILEPLQARARLPLLLSAHGLSDREIEVATLVIRGASTRGIVDALHISRHTVQDHLKSDFDKTGVHSRRQLVGNSSSGRPPTREANRGGSPSRTGSRSGARHDGVPIRHPHATIRRLSRMEGDLSAGLCAGAEARNRPPARGSQ